jgi:hypothetical protein
MLRLPADDFQVVPNILWTRQFFLDEIPLFPDTYTADVATIIREGKDCKHRTTIRRVLEYYVEPNIRRIQDTHPYCNVRRMFKEMPCSEALRHFVWDLPKSSYCLENIMDNLRWELRKARRLQEQLPELFQRQDLSKFTLMQYKEKVLGCKLDFQTYRIY